MKQDKILSIIFGFIGLYLVANAVYLFTLDVDIAKISSYGLILLAILFFVFSFHFFKLSKKANTGEEIIIAKLEKDIDEILDNEEETLLVEDDTIDENNTNTQPLSKLQEEAIDKQKKVKEEISMLKKQLNRSELSKIKFDENAQKTAMYKFFAIDLETTGLDKNHDRIIEIGATLFEAGITTKTFNTLVNPLVNIPSEATAINHIDNQMVENAPLEKEACEQLLTFIKDACDTKTFVCAHNADFDMGFLDEAFRRNELEVKLYYLDTLQIAKEYIKGLPNYKLDTLAKHYHIINKAQHRASEDAEVCGKLLVNILKEIDSKNR